MSEYEDFNDENIYLENFPSDVTTSVLLSNYLKLLDIYHLLFKKNIMTKKINYMNFIYYQGLKTLKHVYTFLLHHTHNYMFTYYHCEKGIYYYTEFISQIENENSFLKLSSNDAIIFVYKKTIYNINKKISSQKQINEVVEINNIIQTIMKIINFKKYDKIREVLPLLGKKNLPTEKIELLAEEGYLEDEMKLVEQLKLFLKN